MNPWLIDFYNNWTLKVQGIVGQDPSHVYDKYMTSFVIYNNLYNQIPGKLVASGVVVPNRIFDNKAATEYVVKFLGAGDILTEFTNNNLDGDIQTIIDLIDQEVFYIRINFNGRQRNEDLKILADLKSNNATKKATGILQVAYYVRCNIFHGHKNFQEYQRILVEPLTQIISVLNPMLFNRLNV
ncbi:MAG: hypothetical protein ABIP44_02655 [Pseudoxanthomonas sp.]